MGCRPIRSLLRLAALATLAAALLVAASARASMVLVNQPYDGVITGGAASQIMPDYPAQLLAFDDLVLKHDSHIDSLIAYGVESTGSNPGLTTAITAEIWSGLPGSPGAATVLSSVSGSQDANQDLLLDFGGQMLAAGTYWLTAYVTRNLDPGGQWYWERNGSVIMGSEHYYYDPSNVFQHGTTPYPGSTAFPAPADLAFTLMGSEIPEPASGAVLLLAASAAMMRGHRRSVP